MKKGLGDKAYTIVEVMIVLAVTGALLVSAMLVISGQQQKTEFNQSIRDIDLRIQDIANDTANGYYPNTGNFGCSSSVGGTTLTPGGAFEQGTNADCIFLGKVIQFGLEGTDGEGFVVYNVYGSRIRESGGNKTLVTNLTEADPKTLSDSQYTETFELQYGLKARAMYAEDGSNRNITAVGFINSRPNSFTGNSFQDGTQAVDLVPLPGTGSASLGQARSTIEGYIDALNAATPVNPSGGVVVCFQSGGTNQHGLVRIGSNNRRIGTELQIGTGACA